jgi:hypothetical protein
MKTKHQTCKYNANRKASKFANPFCIWKPKFVIMPPHIGLKQYEPLTKEICSKCKCWEKNSNYI